MEKLVKIDSTFWKDKKVFVTGHTGFKGSWLTFWLERLNAKVYGYSLESEQNPSLFNLISKSILKEESSCFHKKSFYNIENFNDFKEQIINFSPDVIFHLAAQPLVRESYKDPLKTWKTNLLGTLNLLESVRSLRKKCIVILVTTDKVYKNIINNNIHNENSPLGGHDPYSSSKAACEIAIESYRLSFIGNENNLQNNLLKIASARSGNVIGGGDWSKDRLIPDIVRAVQRSQKVIIRNPKSVRPWQHVLEPLNGYLQLAEHLYKNDNLKCEALNFGPNIKDKKSVIEITKQFSKIWSCEWELKQDLNPLYETSILQLDSKKASNLLGWNPVWNSDKAIERTVNWYKNFYAGKEIIECCLDDLNEFLKDI